MALTPPPSRPRRSGSTSLRNYQNHQVPKDSKRTSNRSPPPAVQRAPYQEKRLKEPIRGHCFQRVGEETKRQPATMTEAIRAPSYGRSQVITRWPKEGTRQSTKRGLPRVERLLEGFVEEEGPELSLKGRKRAWGEKSSDSHTHKGASTGRLGVRKGSVHGAHNPLGWRAGSLANVASLCRDVGVEA